MATAINFPTLSKKPSVDDGLDYEDPALRSQTESGLVITRPRWNKARRTWSYTIRPMSQADKATLDTFVRTTVKGGSASFNWTIPETSQTVEVRFSRLPSFQCIGHVTAYNGLGYNCAFQLEEV